MRLRAAAAQGTLWDQVASIVPADAQLPAPGRLSQHETLAKTLLLLTLVSQGVPTFPQDVLEDERHARALTALHQIRQKFARQLIPPDFASPREIQWHGATPGAQPPTTTTLAGTCSGNFMGGPGVLQYMMLCLSLVPVQNVILVWPVLLSRLHTGLGRHAAGA